MTRMSRDINFLRSKMKHLWQYYLKTLANLFFSSSNYDNLAIKHFLKCIFIEIRTEHRLPLAGEMANPKTDPNLGFFFLRIDK